MLSDSQVRVRHGLTLHDDTTDALAPRLIVSEVDEASPAERTGLQPGDVLISAAGNKVSRRLDFECALIGRKSGEELAVSVRREGKVVDLKLRLAEPSLKDAAVANDATWQTLGLRLESVPTEVFRKYNTRYRGGLRVRDVRVGSPAHSQGIRRGDVLLGIHVWETVTVENVVYILRREDFEEFNPLKFYILRKEPNRDFETLYGYMRVSTGGER